MIRMSKHSKIGVKGEQIAADFLLNKGYIILHRNWRTGRKEVDIVAATGETLVIAEIKTRTTLEFGYPEDAVNNKKKALLRAAAEVYIAEQPQYRHIRFDVISVMMDEGGNAEVIHFEEAFY